VNGERGVVAPRGFREPDEQFVRAPLHAAGTGENLQSAGLSVMPVAGERVDLGHRLMGWGGSRQVGEQSA
jgi:hypothetical protein